MDKNIKTKIKKGSSIKTEMILKYAILILITNILFVTVGFNIAKKALIENSSEILSEFALQVGDDISDIIDLELDKVGMIASTPIIKDASVATETKLDYLRSIVEEYGYKKGALIDLEGNCTTTLGEVVDVSDKEYFPISLGGKSHITAPNISKADGGLQISLTAPIMNGNEVIGIVFMSKDAEKFSAITNSIKFGNSGTAYVVDEKGTNIINNDIQKVIDKVNRIEDAKTDPRFAELAEITKDMIAGNQGTGSYMFNGSKKFLGYAPIDSTGWSVGVTTELNDMILGAKNLTMSLIIVSIIGIMISIVVIFMISSRLTGRLKILKDEVEEIATGNFEAKEINIVKNDEIDSIQISLENTKKSVSEIINSVKVLSENLNSECRELNTVSDKFINVTQNINLSIEESTKASENQANELSNINSILDTFDQKITSNNSNILNINKMSMSISEQANSSCSDMDNLSRFMVTLKSSFDEFSVEMNDMKESMKKINDITKLINAISDQTNLLALNAAIEAARAGEAGKGFSVVADEIRNLAEQSKESTENIYNVISNVLQKTENIANTSEVINDELSRGEGNVKNSVESFESILNMISEISPMINEVTDNFKEILEEKNNIITKVEQASSVSEEISATSQEILSSTYEVVSSTDILKDSTETLNELTEKMESSVSVFKI